MQNGYDKALFLVGFGSDQFWMFFSGFLIHAYMGWPSLITVFVALEVPFKCMQPTTDLQNFTNSKLNENSSFTQSNISGNRLEVWSTTAHPRVFDTFDNQCVERCPSYGYMSKPSSIVSTFDLSCGSGATLVSLTNSSFWVAFLLCCFATGPLADKFGRRRILLPSMIIYCAVTLGLAYVRDIYQFIIVRFICGIFHYPTLTLPYIITMEMVPLNKRAVVSIPTSISFSLGCSLCAIVAYYLQNSWRNQIIAMALSQLPLIILSLFKLPESGRWHLQKRKQALIEQNLLKSAEKNGKNVTILDIKACFEVKTSEDCPEMLKTPETEIKLSDDVIGELKSKRTVVNINSNPNLFDLFHTFKSSLLCFTNAISWFAVSMIFYGLNFGVDILPGNVYINSILLSLIEIPSAVSFLSIDKIGRKLTLVCIFGISSVACLGLPIAKEFLESSVWPLGLAMLGKLVTASGFALVYIYTPEQMPTSLRTTGMSVCSAFARVGTIIAPFVVQLNDLTPFAPYLVYASTGFVACIFVMLFAVETTKGNLPQTISDFYVLVAKGKLTKYETEINI